MYLFLWNILLSFIWALAAGKVSSANLVIGFVLGYLVLWAAQPAIGRSRYFSKIWQIISFLVFFLWELVLANFRVAYDVLTPPYYMRPGVIAIPLDAETDQEITLLANLITLTPGTLSLDVSPDRKVLYVHNMFLDDIEQARRVIKDGFERRLLEVMR